MIDIISRGEWGARCRAGFGSAPLPAHEVWLHHSATRSPGPQASLGQDIAAVRVLEQIGQQRFGGGISYTFVVAESGRIFEGHDVARRGAHTKGHNTQGRAIVLLGNYQDYEPSPAQLAAVAALLRHGHGEGWWTAPQLNGGHRDASGASTACPGNRAHAHIPAINRAAAAAKENEMDADQARKLDEIHDEITKRLPNRRGPRGAGIPGGGEDTVLGYAGNADGFGYRSEGLLQQVLRRLDEVTARLDQVLGDEDVRRVPLYPATTADTERPATGQ